MADESSEPRPDESGPDASGSETPGSIATGSGGRGQEKTGPGTVVLVVGPSGAGKDALLQGVARWLSGDRRFQFPKRLVSRSAHPAEDHDVLQRGEAAVREHPEAFALSWQAHGLTYALPSEIDEIVKSGGCVAFNASRTVVDDARGRFRNVKVVYIDASREVRAERLAARGREDKSEINARLARDVTSFSRSGADVVILNEQSLEEGVASLHAALTGLVQHE